MMRAANIEARAADWLARRDGDNWTADQQQELDAWIATSTAYRIAWLRLDSASRLSWRQGRLVLDGMTLAQAAQEFNRYNKRQLVVADPVAAQLRIGGSFNVDNIDGFARLLQQCMGLTVEARGDTLKIVR